MWSSSLVFTLHGYHPYHPYIPTTQCRTSLHDPMDPLDNPGGGPILGQVPQPPTAQPAVDPMADLAAAMATLANVSTMQLANNLSKAKSVQKPSPFKGEHGSDACQFLAAFTMWAMAQGTALNIVDQQGTAIGCRDMEWIRAALSYL